MAEKQKKEGELPQQGEWPIPYPYRTQQDAYAHAEGLLKQVEMFEREGLKGADESRKAWERKYGEVYRRGNPSPDKEPS